MAVRRLTIDETNALIAQIKEKLEVIELLQANECPASKIQQHKDELYNLCLPLRGATLADAPVTSSSWHD